MKKVLTDRQYDAYDLLIIQDLDEEVAAKMLGFYSNESARKAGYRQIKNLKKIFKEKAIEVIDTEDIIIYPRGRSGS